MTADTLQHCDGGCGRVIDPLNDMPPVDEESVHSTALALGDGTPTEPRRWYCIDCAETLFGPVVMYPIRGLAGGRAGGPWTN